MTYNIEYPYLFGSERNKNDESNRVKKSKEARKTEKPNTNERETCMTKGEKKIRFFIFNVRALAFTRAN